MKFRILLMILGLVSTSVISWGQVDTTRKKTPIEWGNSYKRQFILVQEIKKPGMMNLPLNVQVLSVENLITGKPYYYARFEGYSTDQRGIRIVSINETEIEEAIIFCQKLTEYVKQTKLPHYTEYQYGSLGGEFEIGAYWQVKNITWSFFIRIDPIGLPDATYFFDTTYISQLYQALMNCKATIARLKAGN